MKRKKIGHRDSGSSFQEPRFPDKYPPPEWIKVGLTVIARRWYHDDPDQSYFREEVGIVMGLEPRSIYNVSVQFGDGAQHGVESQWVRHPEKHVSPKADPVVALGQLADMIAEPRRYRAGF
jgi:hypothetical protein